MSIPDDFKILIHSASRMPKSSSPGLFLTIEPSGHCMFFESPPEKDLEFVLKKEIDLDAEAMKKIYETINKEQFFDLKPEYRDPEIMDGDFAEMEITTEGKTHTVKTVNIGVDAFDNIVLEINSHLPEGIDIVYNALHVKGYKRIIR